MKLVNPPYITTKCTRDDCAWSKDQEERNSRRDALKWTEAHTFHTGHAVVIVTTELYETEAFDSR